MKKIITLGLFAFAMLLGTQSITAQNSLEGIKAEAEKKTESLKKLINLEEDQMNDVYKAFVAMGKRKLSLENETNTEETLKRIESNFESKMKSILTQEQFKNFMALPQD